MNNLEEYIEILWTGGLDSSYRIVKLSFCKVTVQPYYISDNRESEELELAAINKISNILKKSKKTKFILLPLIQLKRKEIVISSTVSDSFNKIKERFYVGSQYEWLAEFSKCHTGIEIGMIRGGNFEKMIADKSEFNEYTDLNGINFKLNKSIIDKDIYNIFGDFSFPIKNKTKYEIMSELIDLDLIDLYESTWFCHHPIKNEPCGFCNPCRITLKSGLNKRFSTLAKFRNKFYVQFRLIRKMSSFIKKMC